jgi:peptidoglycan hydrolase-like protein with peptidoglycan-binding domain
VTRKGLDFSWGRPDIGGMLAEGYTFVLRYLSYDDTGKNLSYNEAQSYLNAGIDIVSNWEYDAHAPLNGYSQGVRDAEEAARQHLDCGGPADAPIYFSVDWDASPEEQGVINEYMQGCADVVGLARVGVYAGYWPHVRCLDAGVAVYGWQTYAWSGGNWDPRAHVRQVQNGVYVAGAEVDINTAHFDNFGQWGAFGAGGGAAPVPGDPSSFPYPAGHYLGQPHPSPSCHSGFYGGVDTQNVRTWQQRMHDIGWPIDVDGAYGPQSSQLCGQFQAERGLAVDGLAGPQTWSALWAA